MQLHDSMRPYLKGESFSRGLEVAFTLDAEDYVYETRQDILTRMADGRRVIHAGCVDHSIDLIEKKRSQGLWMHERLHEVASRCVGVDIAEEGVRHMRESLGYEDVLLEDIATGSNPLLENETWDLLFLPEVLEHIGDPVSFLRSMRSRFQRNVEAFIVSVPNAFSRGNCTRAAKGREVINSDHRFWFTPFTAAKVLTDAGYEVEEIRMCANAMPRKFGPIRRRYYERHPLIRDDIILRCRAMASA